MVASPWTSSTSWLLTYTCETTAGYPPPYVVCLTTPWVAVANVARYEARQPTRRCYFPPAHGRLFGGSEWMDLLEHSLCNYPSRDWYCLRLGLLGWWFGDTLGDFSCQWAGSSCAEPFTLRSADLCAQGYESQHGSWENQCCGSLCWRRCKRRKGQTAIDARRWWMGPFQEWWASLAPLCANLQTPWHYLQFDNGPGPWDTLQDWSSLFLFPADRQEYPMQSPSSAKCKVEALPCIGSFKALLWGWVLDSIGGHYIEKAASCSCGDGEKDSWALLGFFLPYSHVDYSSTSWTFGAGSLYCTGTSTLRS